MKNKKKTENHFVVENLIKIMNDRKLTKVEFADLIEFPEAKWNKISNGWQALKVDEISKIAEKLQMREIDIYTFPKIFREKEGELKNTEIKAQLTIELQEDLKQKVLEMIFGKENIEILK
ncbi:MAG: helix-turn-helix transcriptional regulator [Paludibacter sp.]|nr:helix-turn-helix transcriptional regulator [Paludibacter sp.]